MSRQPFAHNRGHRFSILNKIARSVATAVQPFPRQRMIEALESRTLLAANLHIVDAYFVDTNGTKLATVGMGQQPALQVEYTATGLAPNASYDVSLSTGGRTYQVTLNWGAGVAGTSFWVVRSTTMLIRPPVSLFNTFSATLDVNNTVAESDESDNSNLSFYVAATPGPIFRRPLAGTEWVDWSIGNYVDVDAANEGDSVCQDFRGGTFCYDGHNGWDIGEANWKDGYNGVNVYAAAAGTVVEKADGNYDHNTQALGQPANYVGIDHGGGWITYYYHLRKGSVTVNVGDHVVAGQQVGLMGSSGNSTGLHLHWGVTYNGYLIEPMVDPSAFLNYSLGYSADHPTFVGSGTTNYDPGGELSEGPTDVSNIKSAVAGQKMFTWVAPAGINNGDTFQTKWFRPDSSLFFDSGAFVPGQIQGGFWYGSVNMPNPAPIGTWHVKWYINGVQKSDDTFDVDPTGSAQARIYMGGTYVADGRTTPFDFGTVIRNQVSPVVSSTFTVSNVGSVALTPSAPGAPAGFTITNGLAASIAPGGSDAFTVRLDSTTAGHKEGAVAFFNNDPSSGELIQNWKISGDVITLANYNLTDNDDTLYIRRNPGNSANADVWINTSIAFPPTFTVPRTELGNAHFNMGKGDDEVDVDFSNGNPLDSDPIYFNGGTGNNDQLIVFGTSGADVINSIPGSVQLGLFSGAMNYSAMDKLTLDGSAGNNTINIGNGTIAPYAEEILATGGVGSTTVHIHDQNNPTTGAFTFSSNIFGGLLVRDDGILSPTRIRYLGVNDLIVDGGISANDYDVNAVENGTTLTLNTDGGADTITIGVAGGNASGVNGPVIVDGQGGTDTLIYDNTTYAGSTYTLTSTTIANSASSLITYDNVENVEIEAGPHVDTLNIQSTLDTATYLINGNNGNDHFHLSSLIHNLTGIAGAVTVNGNAGNDDLTFHDDGFGPPSFTINTLDKSTFTSSHAAVTTYDTIETLNINLSHDSGIISIVGLGNDVDTLNVDTGDGFDTINVGSIANGLAPLGATATINLTGSLKNDTLNIHDDHNAANDSYTLTNKTFDKTSFGLINYDTIEFFNVAAGSGNNNIDIDSTGAVTFVDGGSGKDVFNVSTGNISTLLGALTVSGGADSDTMLVRDSNFALSTTYTVSDTTVNRPFSAGITYTGLEGVTLSSQDAAGTINVVSTHPGTPVTVDGNDGDDTINVMESSPTADVTVHTGLGSDIVNVNTDNTGSAAAIFDFSEQLAALNIGDNGQVTLTSGSGKSIYTKAISIGQGKLDLNDNDLIVQATLATRDAVLSAVEGYVKSARNTPTLWNGPGITSTFAANQPNKLTGLATIINDDGNGIPLYPTFDAVAVNKAAILVKYTWNGDADLNGKIDADDYFRIDSGFVLNLNHYRNGDFDYSGQVDADDYFLVDSSFIQQSGVLAAKPAATTASINKSHKRRAHHHRSAL